MVKIIGILAILFVCYCEINADNEFQLKLAVTYGEDEERLFTRKRTQEPDSKRRSKSTTKDQPGDRIQENSRNASNMDLSSIDEARNGLDHSAAETLKFKKYEKQIRDEIDELKSSNKPKKKTKHDKYNSTRSRTYDLKKVNAEDRVEKDRKHHEHKRRNEEKKYKDKKNTVSNHFKHSRHLEETTTSYTKTKNITKNDYKNKKYWSMRELEKRKRKRISELDRTSSVKPSRTFPRGPDPHLEEVQQQALDKKVKERPERNQSPPFLRKGSLFNNARKRQSLRSTKMMALYQEDDHTKTMKYPADQGRHWQAGGETSISKIVSPYAIKEQMMALMENFPHVNASFETLGRTVEYNDIFIVKVTDIREENNEENYFRVKEYKYTDDVPEKKIIFIVHGLTVMGLSSLETLTRGPQLEILLSYYLKHLDKFDFFIIPLANPDGYSTVVSPNSDALWNKNLSPQTICSGVCLDRNFDVAWNSSKKISPCSQLYPGPNPFSEIETRVIRDVFHRFGHKILAYIHVHAGTYFPNVFKGDAVLYPRGYTDSPSNEDVYIDIKGEIDEAMKNASFRVMSVAVDTLNNWYGTVRGASVDYAAGVYGIPYAMEFVMQSYDDEVLDNQALTEIWSRVVDVTFKSIWKSVNGSSNMRRWY